MIETHMTKLRNDSRYRHAVIFVYIEANMSFVTASQIRDIVMQPCFYPVIVQTYDQSKEQRTGVWTGPPEKELYANELKRALADGAISFADQFLTENPAVRSELRDQLEVFRREVKMSPQGKRTVEFTGKSPGRKDDLCIVLQMLLYWSRVMRESGEYMQMAEANGWRL